MAFAQTVGTLNTGLVQTDIYDNGFIGTKEDFSGTGFVFDGDNGLFQSTVVVGQGSTADGVPYGASTYTSVSPVTPLSPPFAAPYEEFDQAFQTAFTGTLGETVTLTAYASTSSPNDTFVLLSVNVQNTSGGDVTGVYVGIFADFDIGSATQNLGDYDATSQLLYAFDDSGTSTNYFGIAALGGATVSGYTFSSGTDAASLYTEMTTTAAPPTAVDDRRLVLGTGPYDITAGESVTVDFAMVGGSDQATIIANAIVAQAAVVVANEEGPSALTISLDPAYPNPFRASTTLGYSLEAPQHVRLAVYDVLGREVATLVDESRAAGSHTAVLDAAALPSGTYLVRLEAGSARLSQSLVVIH